MRLLHLHFGKDGGAERFFVKLSGALDRRGVEQAAFIRPDRAWRRTLPPSMRVIEGVPRAINLPWMAWRRDRLIREFRPDGILAWMPRAAAFLPFSAGLPCAIRLGDYPKDLGSFSRADILVCNTPGIAEHVKRLGWSRPAEVISNFSPAPQVSPASRASLDVPPDAFLIVGVGRLVPRKGFADLIRAAAAVEGAHLRLVGDGGEESNLRSLVARLGVTDRVRLLGWRDDPAPVIAAADLFALPSTHEPLGNGILEAWALGKPVVAAASEGPSWVIADGIDGILHAPGDVPGLASAIRRLREDAGLRARIASGGADTLAARFSEGGVCRAYLGLFRSRT